MVKPISSRRAYRAFGVCSHPNFGTTVYKNTTDWMDALAKTGASYFRGLYADSIYRHQDHHRQRAPAHGSSGA